jgi:SAM-dependent methyltransferase
VTSHAAPRTLLAPGSDQFDALAAWAREDLAPGATVLDVGAGDGDAAYPGLLRPPAGRIVGVDPDPGVQGNTHLDEAFQGTLEEFAAARSERFDLAVAVYVVEHVAEPGAFLASLRRCLRPGGRAFLLTPHRWHYFGLAALVANRLGADEWLLHRLRDEHTLHEHHFPIQYRLNDRRTVQRLAARAGFAAAEFRMLEDPRVFQPYFPEPARWIPSGYARVVHRLAAAPLAGTMLVRLTA